MLSHPGGLLLLISLSYNAKAPGKAPGVWLILVLCVVPWIIFFAYWLASEIYAAVTSSPWITRAPATAVTATELAAITHGDSTSRTNHNAARAPIRSASNTSTSSTLVGIIPP